MVYISHLRAATRFAAYLLWVGIIIPVQAVNLLLRLKFAKKWPLTAHRVCASLLGIKMVTFGKPLRQGRVLFVVNHTSYADISVLGAQIEACFVAKAEVAKWPIFGMCAKLQRTVFVDRRPRFAAQQAEILKNRLSSGDNLILFPEGTSNDGNFVLPFRSALFSAATIRIDDEPVIVQPVSMAYTHLDGIPMGRHLRPFFAWYGDMELASHLWQFLGIGRSRIVTRFHEPVTIDQFKSRKEMAAWCQAVIAAGVAESLTGHPQPVIHPGPSKAGADKVGAGKAALLTDNSGASAAT